MLPFVLLCAFIWGVGVALFMEFTTLGDFISKRLTWFITALGCGVDLLLVLLLVDNLGRVYWWQMVAIFFVSSMGPSYRGILAHKNYFVEWIDGARNSAGK